MVQEYNIGEDKNVLTFQRQWTVHTSTVTGLIYSNVMNQIYSCSKDKLLVWHCSETSIKLGNCFLFYILNFIIVIEGSYSITSPCTCMSFDVGSKFVFIGDYAGNVYVLRLVRNTVQLVSKLSAHTGLTFVVENFNVFTYFR